MTTLSLPQEYASVRTAFQVSGCVIDNNNSQECTAAQVRELLHGREGIDT